MTTPRPLQSSGFLILSACLLLTLSFGYRSGFGLFVPPITEANGWSREVISLSLAIQNLVWGIVAVFAGGLADRFGNVRVIVAGAALYSGGMWLMAGVDSPWLLHSSAGLMVGAGIAGTAFGIVLPAMARAVPEERRQWALGVGTAAGSLGQFLVVPVAQSLIDAFGWIAALQVLSVTALAMALLAMPLAPYSGAGDNQGAGAQQSIREALGEALRHPSFLLLVGGFYVCGFQVAFVTAHMPAFLQDAGFDPRVGAWAVAIIGLCNVAGAFLSGILSGRFPKRWVLVVIYAVRALAVSAFMLIPMTLTSVLVFSAVLGLFWLATIPPTSGLVAVMFGTRYMALLYGVVFLSHQVGSFCGVWLGGVLYAQTGSYDLVWWLGALLALAAALVHLPIREEAVPRLQLARSV
ncbi:MFS transporter [Motiliproteus sp. SC1-56]|uniref:MFS transporter n=1 Tax=Motiliproteus sp. SC1-56 TaxID=2799565 RepID=UPI001A8DA3B8|nr:MFS transporter [Motiliproteus sp. SC1-56]